MSRLSHPRQWRIITASLPRGEVRLISRYAPVQLARTGIDAAGNIRSILRRDAGRHDVRFRRTRHQWRIRAAAPPPPACGPQVGTTSIVNIDEDDGHDQLIDSTGLAPRRIIEGTVSKAHAGAFSPMIRKSICLRQWMLDKPWRHRPQAIIWNDGAAAAWWRRHIWWDQFHETRSVDHSQRLYSFSRTISLERPPLRRQGDHPKDTRDRWNWIGGIPMNVHRHSACYKWVLFTQGEQTISGRTCIDCSDDRNVCVTWNASEAESVDKRNVHGGNR